MLVPPIFMPRGHKGFEDGEWEVMESGKRF